MTFKTLLKMSIMIPALSLSLNSYAAEKETPAKEAPVAVKTTSAENAEMMELAKALAKNKKFGLIGERVNGYVAPVRPRKSVNEVVRKVNEGRLKHYRRIAEQSGFSMTEIERLAGEKAAKNAPVGHYIEIDRLWIKKQ